MPPIHRENDQRYCGASTISEGQSKVFVAGQKVAVVGDPETHGEGRFIDNAHKMLIAGKRIITIDDLAEADLASHPTGPTNAATGHGKVIVK